MTDKCTELAREFIRGHMLSIYSDTPGAVGDLTMLLRRVAREQIEEDAGVVARLDGEKEQSIQTVYVQGMRGAYKDTLNALRTRAKELED